MLLSSHLRFYLFQNYLMFVSFLACRTDTNLSEVSWMGFWLQTFKLAHIQFQRNVLKEQIVKIKILCYLFHKRRAQNKTRMQHDCTDKKVKCHFHFSFLCLMLAKCRLCLSDGQHCLKNDIQCNTSRHWASLLITGTRQS